MDICGCKIYEFNLVSRGGNRIIVLCEKCGKEFEIMVNLFYSVEVKLNDGRNGMLLRPDKSMTNEQIEPITIIY